MKFIQYTDLINKMVFEDDLAKRLAIGNEFLSQMKVSRSEIQLKNNHTIPKETIKKLIIEKLSEKLMSYGVDKRIDTETCNEVHSLKAMVLELR